MMRTPTPPNQHDKAQATATEVAMSNTSGLAVANESWQSLLAPLQAVLLRLEGVLPPRPTLPNFAVTLAAEWQRPVLWATGFLRAIETPAMIELAALQNIDDQKARIEQNTRQFVQGMLANNVLLTGARGCGKSSLVKAMLTCFADQGLRIIEVDKERLSDLSQIIELIKNFPYRFIIFCDDLAFEAGDPGYKALKVALDGSLATKAANVLIYATSNRRHLMPEYQQDNHGTQIFQKDGQMEMHPNEAVEEKLALSERFGIWLSFYPFTQDEYLQAVDYWLDYFNLVGGRAQYERLALQWALGRGSRSGRVAYQFVLSQLQTSPAT